MTAKLLKSGIVRLWLLSKEEVMSLPYKSTSVAAYFLRLGEREEVHISHMKLQKLIYFAHGWCLAISSKHLIEENIEAWKFGPVIGSVYQTFRSFGSAPITGPLTINLSDFKDLESDDFAVDLIERVWSVYKQFTAFQLSEMTHMDESPWEKAMQKGNLEKRSNVTIDNQLIKQYFVSHAKDHG